jgi:subtilisin
MAAARTGAGRPEGEGPIGSERPAGGSNVSVLEGERKQYLIAPRRGHAARRQGLQPMSAGQLQGLVNQIPELEVVRTMRSRSLSPFAAGPAEASEVYVVRVDAGRAEVLRQTAPAHLIIEEDAHLQIGKPFSPRLAPFSTNWRLMPRLKSSRITIQVLGHDEKPLSNAAVRISGEGFPGEGITDSNGKVQLEVYLRADGHAYSVFVNADRGHWDRYIDQPELIESRINVVRLQSLRETVKGFPEHFPYGWGMRAIGLDRIDPRFSGRGVKIAIVDSGADTQHPLLRHITEGLDLTNAEDRSSWKQDLIGHGSHCAGTITAKGEEGTLRGLAPEAEVHVFKIFPGGQYSSLLDALDLCIARGIDVVNLSLGSDQPSEAVEQKLEECVAHGIAVIVAAGNSGGPVQYPASSPNVLAVSALGKLGEFPQGSWDQQTVLPGELSRDGLFSPSFTCFGPQVAVCAPGVGIISTVPGEDYDPQSGTSMAAPHVSGLAALLLAHHPMFVQQGLPRGPQRVAALFQLIRAISVPAPFGLGRSGAGLPRLDAVAHQLMAPSDTIGAQSGDAARSRPQQSVPIAVPLGYAPSVPLHPLAFAYPAPLTGYPVPTPYYPAARWPWLR